MLKNGSKNQYFQGGTVTCIFFILSLIALSSAISFAAEERKLSFYNTHTRERLTVFYKNAEDYNPAALRKINHMRRW